MSAPFLSLSVSAVSVGSTHILCASPAGAQEGNPLCLPYSFQGGSGDRVENGSPKVAGSGNRERTPSLRRRAEEGGFTLTTTADMTTIATSASFGGVGGPRTERGPEVDLPFDQPGDDRVPGAGGGASGPGVCLERDGASSPPGHHELVLDDLF